MTQVFENGDRIPVTVLELGPNVVIQKKTQHTKDGYAALQVGFDEVEHRKVTKPMLGHFAKSDVKPRRRVMEFRIPEGDVEGHEVGHELKADIFAEGEIVDVTGTTKGKGFQGVVRRHGMKGAKQDSHGTHEQFRHVGSIGCRTTPGEVHKGKRLPGHMGNVRVTTQNVRIVKIDLETNRVLIRGSVPGSRNSYVVVRKSAKKPGKVVAAA
ncbi:MAG: 50S ribosomal protein L3 [Myxococcales bacterium]|nr:50S ribosomal protein L3 [Myxococcales bacterium]